MALTLEVLVNAHAFTPISRSALLEWTTTRARSETELSEVGYVVWQINQDPTGPWSEIYHKLIGVPYAPEDANKEEYYGPVWTLLRSYSRLIRVFNTLSGDQSLITEMTQSLQSVTPDTKEGQKRFAQEFAAFVPRVVTKFLDPQSTSVKIRSDLEITPELVNALMHAQEHNSEDLKAVLLTSLAVGGGSEAAQKAIRNLPRNEPYKDEQEFLQGPGTTGPIPVKPVQDSETVIAEQKTTCLWRNH